MKTQVIINTEVIGFHNYPNAPEKVLFLRNKHRHIFTIKAGFEVQILDREKEIYILQNDIEDYLYKVYGNPCNFNEMSCEMIAKEVIEFCEPDNCKWVEVLEDNKGGARVEL
ncbi:MAG TPA: hypothetical protein GX708_06915 [Gallicola sp.]|nr:hypothetical protein [Gallicola sp.]